MGKQSLLFTALFYLGLGLALPARAQQQRFDVQPWRPSPGPRDLVIVPQSQPLRDLSFAGGAYLSFALDPLTLVTHSVSGATSQINAVHNRLELDLMAAIGIADLVEIGLVMPLVLYQVSDNLQATGTEGVIANSVQGDLSLISKVEIWSQHGRKLAYGDGFGSALSLRVNFPTGSQKDFTSDGSVAVNPTAIFDYRFLFGGLISSQFGVYFHPTGQFLNVKLGPTFTGAVGVEVPIVRHYGLGAVGGAYTNIPLTKLPESAQDVPIQGMLGLRWYADFGVAFTTGVNFGSNCSFGSSSFAFFLSAIWVPGKTKEREALQEFRRPPDDPDHDGLIGEQDFCPTVWGPVENHGCPPVDTDKDGIPDFQDGCPTLSGPSRYGGCPRVFASKNKIEVLEKVQFPTDQDIILPESFGVLEEVSVILKRHPEWQEILIEGHCDSRAGDAYNLDLSQRRAQSVMRFLLAHEVEPSRLRAQGFGRSMPISTNRTEEGMALNRRVSFTLLSVAGGEWPKDPRNLAAVSRINLHTKPQTVPQKKPAVVSPPPAGSLSPAPLPSLRQPAGSPPPVLPPKPAGGK